MTLSRLVLVGPAALLASALFGAPVWGGDIKVTEMAVTTKIVKGKPIDSVHQISSKSVKALYCFTRLVSPEETDTTIKQVWYQNDEPVGEYELPVKGGRWRTYSKKVVEKGSAGEWRCDALDTDGNVLRSVAFRMN